MAPSKAVRGALLPPKKRIFLLFSSRFLRRGKNLLRHAFVRMGSRETESASRRRRVRDRDGECEVETKSERQKRKDQVRGNERKKIMLLPQL